MEIFEDFQSILEFRIKERAWDLYPPPLRVVTRELACGWWSLTPSERSTNVFVVHVIERMGPGDGAELCHSVCTDCMSAPCQVLGTWQDRQKSC